LARLTPARLLLFGLVASALATVACSKGNSSSQLPPGATPTPTVSPTVGPSSTPPPASGGIAFIPDAGNGGPGGITVAHFEEFGGGPFPYKPQFVSFRSSVRQLAIDSSGTTGLAVIKNSNGAYTLLQGILGLNTGTIFPGGAPYDTSVPPPSPAPTNAVIPDITEEGMLAAGSNAVGLSMGPGGAGILGVNQASVQSPTYNGFIGYTCKSRTPTFLSGYSAVAASTTTNTNSGDYSLLVRGPQSLLSFSVIPNFGVIPPRFTICYQVQDVTLGARVLATPGAAGHGVMSFSPTDASRAILGQVGAANEQVILLTNLPFQITKSPPLSLNGGRVNSIAFSPDGAYGAVGTDAGLFIVSGLSGSTLTIVGQGANKSKAAFSPNYKGADGAYHHLANVTSVGFSSDGTFLSALISLIPNSPGGGNSGTMVALPFNTATGTLAAPAIVDNNLPLNAYYQDILTVR